MSHFDGLEKMGWEPNQVYLPASQELDEVVRQLMEVHADGTLMEVQGEDYNWPKGHERATELVRGMLGPLEGREEAFDSVLEGVIGKLSVMSPVDIELLLNPLVQALYEKEHHDFSLDLTSMDMDSQDIASYLTGTKRKPLRLSYRVDSVQSFGWNSYYSELTLYGSCEEAGAQSEHCSITIHGEVRQIGQTAQYCSFYLDSLDGVTYDYRDFRAYHNHLFVPDGAGQWKEVRP